MNLNRETSRQERIWAEGYSRPREGGHGPRPEGPGHRWRLGQRRRRGGRIGESGGRRDRGGAEGRVGEETAGAGVPEHRGGSHRGGGGGGARSRVERR